MKELKWVGQRREREGEMKKGQEYEEYKENEMHTHSLSQWSVRTISKRRVEMKVSGRKSKKEEEWERKKKSFLRFLSESSSSSSPLFFLSFFTLENVFLEALCGKCTIVQWQMFHFFGERERENNLQVHYWMCHTPVSSWLLFRHWCHPMKCTNNEWASHCVRFGSLSDSLLDCSDSLCFQAIGHIIGQDRGCKKKYTSSTYHCWNKILPRMAHKDALKIENSTFQAKVIWELFWWT